TEADSQRAQAHDHDLSAEQLGGMAWASFRRDFSRQNWTECARMLERAVSLNPRSIAVLAYRAHPKVYAVVAGRSEAPDDDLRIAEENLAALRQLRPKHDGDL